MTSEASTTIQAVASVLSVCVAVTALVKAARVERRAAQIAASQLKIFELQFTISKRLIRPLLASYTDNFVGHVMVDLTNKGAGTALRPHLDEAGAIALARRAPPIENTANGAAERRSPPRVCGLPRGLGCGFPPHNRMCRARGFRTSRSSPLRRCPPTRSREWSRSPDCTGF